MKRLVSSELRDRDAILTADRMIFRVYGYTHPPNAYICDPEYAPAGIFKSEEPRAYRASGRQVYYKFFADDGLRFVMENCPKYMVWHPALQRSLVGVAQEQIVKIKTPTKTLHSLLKREQTDPLLQALRSLLDLLRQRLGLLRRDFGVFGSLLQSFYHPMFSDLDLIIYGRTQLNRLRESLQELYSEGGTIIRNEFDSVDALNEKRWEFRNYSLKDYVWHQRRKQIYALYRDKESRRTIKSEFEPVKRWEEIQNTYNPSLRIVSKGWIKLKARVTDDTDAPFIPSIYGIEPLEILKGKRAGNIERILSYVEEFRLQAKRDEIVVVEGNLEELNTPNEAFDQITLTYCPRYYDQTLRVAEQS